MQNEWEKFYGSGKIMDYLNYKGIGTDGFLTLKGDNNEIDNDIGNYNP